MEEDDIDYMLSCEGFEIHRASVAWWPVMIADIEETDACYLTNEEKFIG